MTLEEAETKLYDLLDSDAMVPVGLVDNLLSEIFADHKEALLASSDSIHQSLVESIKDKRTKKNEQKLIKHRLLHTK
jgi:recombinational DNA repair ATPase RecF